MNHYDEILSSIQDIKKWKRDLIKKVIFYIILILVGINIIVIGIGNIVM